MTIQPIPAGKRETLFLKRKQMSPKEQRLAGTCTHKCTSTPAPGELRKDAIPPRVTVTRYWLSWMLSTLSPRSWLVP